MSEKTWLSLAHMGSAEQKYTNEALDATNRVMPLVSNVNELESDLNEIVSIIVPVYNLEKKISKCIESVLAQTYPYFELILVNDGSKDKSLEIMKRYANKDNRIKIINQDNQGVEKTRMNAIKVHSGKWIMFVDGDDWVSNDAIEIMINDAITNKVDVVVANNYKVIDRWSIIKKKSRKSTKTTVVTKEAYMSNYFISFFGCHRYSAASLCAKLYKSELFDTSKLEIYGLHFGEDEMLNLQIMPYANGVSFIDRYVYYYRYGGMTNHHNPYLLDNSIMNFRLKNNAVIKDKVKDGLKFLRIEFLNIARSYIQSLCYYKVYTKEKIIKEIERVVNLAEYQESLDVKSCSNICDNNPFVAASCIGDFEKMYEIVNKDITNNRLKKWFQLAISKILV